VDRPKPKPNLQEAKNAQLLSWKEAGFLPLMVSNGFIFVLGQGADEAVEGQILLQFSGLGWFQTVFLLLVKALKIPRILKAGSGFEFRRGFYLRFWRSRCKC